MEFPSLGGHCEASGCHALSFLPFQCSFCQRTFCSGHHMPGDHACPQCFDTSSVQLCPACDRLVLSTGGVDPKLILQEHLDSNCARHLLPPVASTTVPCSKIGCKRQDRVVSHCEGCDQTYCLGHRHATDHDCIGLVKKKEQEERRKADIREKIAKQAGKYPRREQQQAPSSSVEETILEGGGNEDAANAKKKLSTKEVIEAAKAKVALRSRHSAAQAPLAVSSVATSADTAASSRSPSAMAPRLSTTPSAAAEKPKSKRPSRTMALIQLRKVAQGDAKVAGAQRIYLHIRSPTIQGVTSKSVFLDKTWTVGKSMDRIIEILKVVPPKSDPNVPAKRLSIFHAKEEDSEPALLAMSAVIKDIPGIESGDIFHLASSDWDKMYP